MLTRAGLIGAGGGGGGGGEEKFTLVKIWC